MGATTLYFEVKNAAIFGGEGSVGYTSAAFSDVQHIEALDDDFITAQKKITGKMLNVSADLDPEFLHSGKQRRLQGLFLILQRLFLIDQGGDLFRP